MLIKQIIREELRQLNEGLGDGTYGEFKVGDKVLEDANMEMHPLPDSQVPVEDGVYQLQYIPIDKTDIVIDGLDNRSVFDNDDYDGYQTNTFNFMLKNYDRLPPTIWEEKDDGTYGHIDGHHRIIIAKELGNREILGFVKQLDQSKGDVINKPTPRFKDISKDQAYLLRSVYSKDERFVFYYEGKEVSLDDAFGLVHTDELKVLDRKFIPYL